MKVSKFLGAGAAVTLSALMLAACGSSSSSSKSTTRKTLNWTVASEIPTMDLSKATDATSFNQISNTMEGLYRLGKNSKLEKGLATSEKVSKDGLTYTYTLRKSKWSDGTELRPRTSSTPGGGRSTPRLLRLTPTFSPASRTPMKLLPARSLRPAWASRL